MVSVEEDPHAEGECLCGQQNLRYMYTIHNQHTDKALSYIGSQCVNHFKREDLDLQVTALSQLLALRKNINAGKPIALTSEHFSRALLGWMYEEGAFNSERNNFNGAQDYNFLLDMFNKHNKDDITSGQQKKIWVMMKYYVTPFVDNHPALAA